MGSIVLKNKTFKTLYNRKIVFVLESVSLDIAKVGKAYEILSHENHPDLLIDKYKDSSKCRPEDCHQALLAILDSALNKTGNIECVYVCTTSDVLIRVNPNIRLPRTFVTFSNMII